MTVLLAGCVVMDGDVLGVVTVRVAGLLVTLPALFVTVTVNWAPLSEVVVAGVVYEAAVAPLTEAPFFCHW